MRGIVHEIKYTVCSRKFWISILGMVIISIFCLADEMKMAPKTSVYYLYTVYFYYPVWRAFLVFAAIPGAIGFCTDWNSGSYRLKVIRSGKKPYALSKILACMISAFLVVVFSQICMLAILSIRYPMFAEGDGNILVGGIYEKYLDSGKIWIYFLNRILLQSLGTAFFSVLALWISVKIPDTLVTVTAPIICYYFIENMTSWLGIPVFLSIPKFLKGNIEILKSLGYTWLYAGAFWGILSVMFGFLFYRNCKRRIENG